MSELSRRLELYEKIQNKRSSKIIAFVNGDRPQWETQLSRDFADIAVEHLDLFDKTEKISVILYTNGGDTLAAWRLVHLLRQFCKTLEVLVPLKALSAGTLMALGADVIVMTKQASLGPIDPSVNTPLNPIIPGGPSGARVSVSVEAIKGYLEIATKELDIKDDSALAGILTSLSGNIHPLVLGQVFRSRAQIQFLARRLLKNQVSNKDKIEEIIAFLCSESGSHDYTIDRREARDLGLTIETPDEELYSLLRDVHHSFRRELEISEPFDVEMLLGTSASASYSVRRCLIESIQGGGHVFVSQGVLTRQTMPSPLPGSVPMPGISDTRQFEGWKKVS